MSAIDTVIANYNAAVEEDNQKWAQRIIDTTVSDEFSSPVFSQGEQGEPYQSSPTMRNKVVCHNGVPANQRFAAGPPVDI